LMICYCIFNTYGHSTQNGMEVSTMN